MYSGARFVSLLRFTRKRKAKPEPGWRAVRRAAQLRERKITRAFRNAAQRGKKAIHSGVFQDSFMNRETDQGAIDRSADVAVALIEAPFREELTRALRETLFSAGKAELSFRQRPRLGFRITAEPRFAKSPAMVSFNVSNPAAIRWIRDHAGEQIQGISAQSREAIRVILADAYKRGLPNSNVISRIRSVIGLNQQQGTAVMNLADSIASNPGGRVYAGDRAIRVPDEPTVDWIDGQLDSYADRLLTDRAKTIARTETISAANEGQRQAWLQAEEAGLLDRDLVERVWIVTPDDRLCPICEELEGATAELDGEFPDGLSGPPAHPNCRCAQGLQRAGKERAASEHLPLLLVDRWLAFDPDQARDERGQWTSGGGIKSN